MSRFPLFSPTSSSQVTSTGQDARQVTVAVAIPFAQLGRHVVHRMYLVSWSRNVENHFDMHTSSIRSSSRGASLSTRKYRDRQKSIFSVFMGVSGSSGMTGGGRIEDRSWHGYQYAEFPSPHYGFTTLTLILDP